MGGIVSVSSVLGEGSIFAIIFKVMCKVPNTKVLEKQISSKEKESILIMQ